jgi:hypothetical protein
MSNSNHNQNGDSDNENDDGYGKNKKKKYEEHRPLVPNTNAYIPPIVMFPLWHPKRGMLILSIAT